MKDIYQYKRLIISKVILLLNYRILKKVLKDSKTVTLGVCNLKTSLGQFGSKVFSRGLIKALVKNPGSNFHKQDLIFSIIKRSQKIS